MSLAPVACKLSLGPAGVQKYSCSTELEQSWFSWIWHPEQYGVTTGLLRHITSGLVMGLMDINVCVWNDAELGSPAWWVTAGLSQCGVSSDILDLGGWHSNTEVSATYSSSTSLLSVLSRFSCFPDILGACYPCWILPGITEYTDHTFVKAVCLCQHLNFGHWNSKPRIIL